MQQPENVPSLENSKKKLSAKQFKANAKKPAGNIPPHIDKPAYAQQPHGPKTEKTLKPDDPKVLKAVEEAKKQFAALKKILKHRSKGEMIKMVVQYASDIEEYQGITQQLLEENKRLRSIAESLQKRLTENEKENENEENDSSDVT